MSWKNVYRENAGIVWTVGQVWSLLSLKIAVVKIELYGWTEKYDKEACNLSGCVIKGRLHEN